MAVRVRIPLPVQDYHFKLKNIMKLLLVNLSPLQKVKCPYKIVIQFTSIPRYTPTIGDAYCRGCKFYNGDVDGHRLFYVKCNYENY